MKTPEQIDRILQTQPLSDFIPVLALHALVWNYADPWSLVDFFASNTVSYLWLHHPCDVLIPWLWRPVEKIIRDLTTTQSLLLISCDHSIGIPLRNQSATSPLVVQPISYLLPRLQHWFYTAFQKYNMCIRKMSIYLMSAVNSNMIINSPATTTYCASRNYEIHWHQSANLVSPHINGVLFLYFNWPPRDLMYDDAYII